MNLAKKKPATLSSDGRYQKGNLERKSDTINPAPKSILGHGLGGF